MECAIVPQDYPGNNRTNNRASYAKYPLSGKFSHLTTFIGTVIRLFMSTPPAAASAEQPTASPRQRFLRRIAALPIRPAAREYYVRWAEAWTKARGNRSPDTTTAFFDSLGRTAHLADWQFRQAVDAARILAHEILAIPWAASYDWQGLSDQARSLEPHHRTLARETIQVRAE